MIKIAKVEMKDGRSCKAPDCEHRAEAENQLDSALQRIRSDTEASVHVGEGKDAHWTYVPTWSGADLSTARIVAEVAMRHPDIVVTGIHTKCRDYPLSKESGLVIGLWPDGYLCYTGGDRLSFRTGYDGNFPEHLRGTLEVTVGDDIQGAFAALTPRLKALRQWGDDRVQRRKAEIAAKEAERTAREADGRTLADHLARLIMAEDPLALAEAVNAAIRGMSQGGVSGATMAADRVAFVRSMTGMPPMTMGVPMDPRDWSRGRRGFAWRREEAMEGGRD